MYNPSRYASESSEQIDEIVRDFPLATMITVVSGEPHVSHVPLILEKRGEKRVLVGHLARANPHWKALSGNETLAIFHGPQAYITPLWYEQCDVPTWNYVVAHLSGVPQLLDSEEGTVQALRKLTDRTEGKGGWEFEIPADLAAPGVLMKSIIGFEIPVSTMSAKLKLSQNKSSTDFHGVLRGLETQRTDEQSKRVLEWMSRFVKQIVK